MLYMMPDVGKRAAAEARGSNMQARRRSTSQTNHGGGKHQLGLFDGARELRVQMWGLEAGARLRLELQVGPGTMIPHRTSHWRACT
jgi:hypothetical protein